MKTLNMRRALSAALTGLALAAITQVSYAAGDVASQTQIVDLSGGIATRPCAGNRRAASVRARIAPYAVHGRY